MVQMYISILIDDRLSLLAKVLIRDLSCNRDTAALTNSLPGVSNTNQEASIGGSVAAAHYIRSVAPLYGIPVVLHTARE